MMNTGTILKEALRDRMFSPEEFVFLFSRGEKENEILAAADEINHSLNGDRVTFVHNRNLNYTNVCVNRCSFCGFRRNEEERDSYFWTVGEILAKLGETPDVSEVCIQGGLHPGLEFSFVLEMLQEIRTQFPGIHIHAFSPMEIYYFSQKTGRPVRSILESLIDRGLGSLPGTAAEILDDRVRQQICPEKVNVATWVEIVKTAHRLGLKSTATILLGHVEGPDQIALHLQVLRDIQHETSGFTEFIPLPFVPFETALGRRSGIREMLPFRRIRLFYALCRLFFGRSIPNIQASWPKLGLDRALECVFSGVNDLGGTLYQENITRSAGGVHGEKVSLGQLKRAIEKAGKTPQLRDTLYNPLSDQLLSSLIRKEGGADHDQKEWRGPNRLPLSPLETVS